MSKFLIISPSSRFHLHRTVYRCSIGQIVLFFLIDDVIGFFFPDHINEIFVRFLSRSSPVPSEGFFISVFFPDHVYKITVGFVTFIATTGTPSFLPSVLKRHRAPFPQGHCWSGFYAVADSLRAPVLQFSRVARQDYRHDR